MTGNLNIISIFSTLMRYHSGLDQLDKKKNIPLISSGDATLDELLEGGFQKEFLYLLYGDRKVISNILMKTAVLLFTNEDFTKKVAFVDGNNRFNPYQVSKFAAYHGLSPKGVLENILIARAFTYEQMIELLENRVSKLESVKAVLISGITMLWPNYELRTFEELNKAIQGIKEIMERVAPLIIITALLHQCSAFKPIGGHNLTHFGHVLILVENKERCCEYSLIQHPSLPESTLKRWHPKKTKSGLNKSFQSTTLDLWLK